MLTMGCEQVYHGLAQLRYERAYTCTRIQENQDANSWKSGT
jgi:hypothetical protein